MNKRKQVIKKNKLPIIIYFFLSHLFIGIISVMKFSYMPMWPDEIISKSIFILLYFLSAFALFCFTKETKIKFLIYFIINISGFALLIPLSSLAYEHTGTYSLYLIIPILASLFLGYKAALLINFPMVISIFLFADLDVEYLLYLFLIAMISVFVFTLFSSLRQTFILSIFVFLINLFLSTTLQILMYNRFDIIDFIVKVD